ncbi:MAG: nucleotidyltransferase family protein [Nanoarchaeota archaeon]
MVKSMELKDRILMHLIQNKTKEFSINEMSKLLNKNYKNVYNAVKKIQNSIKITKRINSSLLRFKPELTNDIYFLENMRKEQLIKKLNLIYLDIKRIKNPHFIAVLFGSYAKGTQTKNSDIDVCIIHDNEEEFKTIHSALSIHPKLELHEFYYNDFMSMLNEKSFNVGHEIARDGVVLKNIESYYELIKYE